MAATRPTQCKQRPQRKHIRLPPDAYHKPGAWYFVTICCRNKKRHFDLPARRTLVEQVLRQTARTHRVQLAAYTILPDHLHLICTAGQQGLMAFIRQFKSSTATQMRRRGEGPSPWQGRFFDHKIRSDESLRQKCAYVWMNPVRRGLAVQPEDYSWNGSLTLG